MSLGIAVLVTYISNRELVPLPQPSDFLTVKSSSIQSQDDRRRWTEMPKVIRFLEHFLDIDRSGSLYCSSLSVTCSSHPFHIILDTRRLDYNTIAKDYKT